MSFHNYKMQGPVAASMAVVVSLCPSLAVNVQAAAEATQGTNPRKAPSVLHVSLREYVKNHPTKILLVGDGTSTSHCQLILQDKITGATSTTELTTVCASRKSLKAPATLADVQKNDIQYHIGKTDPSVVATIQAAYQLNQQGAFANVALPPSRKLSTIKQLAIWKKLGGNNPDPKDAVTNQSVKSDLLTRSHIDPSTLTAKESQKLDDRVSDILNAVDLTAKTSTTLIAQEPKQPKKPDQPITPDQPGIPPIPDDSSTPDTPDNPDIPNFPIDVPGTSNNTTDNTTTPPTGGVIDVPSYTTFVCDNPDYQDIMTDGGSKPKDDNHTVDKGGVGGGGQTTDGGGQTTDGGGQTTSGGGTTVSVGGDGITVDKPPPPPPLSAPPPPPSIPHPKKLGIALKRLDDSWVPEDPSHTSVFAQIYEQEGQVWVPSDTPAKITFHFFKRSSEPGVCMNHQIGMADLPDLYFRQAFNPDLNCIDNSAAQDLPFYSDTAVTKTEVIDQVARIDCEDFGAYSTVEATAPDCCPLKYDGVNHVVGPVSQEEARVKVPKDDNDNQIADGYVDLCNNDQVDNPKATDDKDKFPVGNGVEGDGFSAYEEYRGFMVSGDRHIRTSWFDKDLFIHDSDCLGLHQFPGCSGLRCHLIAEGQWSGDEGRVINFENGNAHLVDQHGLLLEVRSLPSGVGGMTSDIGPPKNVEWVAIADPYKAEWSVAHELGHATGLHHHGDSALWWAPPVPLSKYLTGTPYYLGVRHGQSSGEFDCIMRYYNPYQTVRPSFSGLEYWSYRMPGRFLFCSSPAGTEDNAGDQHAGDAEVGNCEGQFIVNDGAN
jgi:hypothetical protein